VVTYNFVLTLLKVILRLFECPIYWPFDIFLGSRPFYLELRVVRCMGRVSGYLSKQLQRNSGTRLNISVVVRPLQHDLLVFVLTWCRNRSRETDTRPDGSP
jgi:hypothetical protein